MYSDRGRASPNFPGGSVPLPINPFVRSVTIVRKPRDVANSLLKGSWEEKPWKTPDGKGLTPHICLVRQDGDVVNMLGFIVKGKKGDGQKYDRIRLTFYGDMKAFNGLWKDGTGWQPTSAEVNEDGAYTVNRGLETFDGEVWIVYEWELFHLEEDGEVVWADDNVIIHRGYRIGKNCLKKMTS